MLLNRELEMLFGKNKKKRWNIRRNSHNYFSNNVYFLHHSEWNFSSGGKKKRSRNTFVAVAIVFIFSSQNCRRDHLCSLSKMKRRETMKTKRNKEAGRTREAVGGGGGKEEGENGRCRNCR